MQWFIYLRQGCPTRLGLKAGRSQVFTSGGKHAGAILMDQSKFF